MTDDVSVRSGAPATISRRRIVQGAAWAVPAVVVATAAPAFAGSNPSVNPSLGVTATGYVPNPGESQQSIKITIQRQDNNSTHSLKIVAVKVYFTQDTNGQFKESLGVSNNTNTWVYDAASSTMPTTVGGAGIAVFTPVGGSVTLAGTAATILDFNINRFENISQVVIEGLTGSTLTTPVSTTVYPVKLKK